MKITNLKLNTRQQALVEKNHNLIYGFLRHKGLSEEAVDDWFGTAAIGLCKAAYYYDEARNNSFSCFAYKVMLNEVRLNYRNNNKGVKSFSIEDDEEKANDTYSCLADKKSDDFILELEVKAILEKILKKFDETTKKIVDLKLKENKSICQICEELGISRQTYYNKIKKLGEKLYPALRAE